MWKVELEYKEQLKGLHIGRRETDGKREIETENDEQFSSFFLCVGLWVIFFLLVNFFHFKAVYRIGFGLFVFWYCKPVGI